MQSGICVGAHLKRTVLPLCDPLQPLNIHTQIVKVPSGGERRRGARESKQLDRKPMTAAWPGREYKSSLTLLSITSTRDTGPHSRMLSNTRLRVTGDESAAESHK